MRIIILATLIILSSCVNEARKKKKAKNNECKTIQTIDIEDLKPFEKAIQANKFFTFLHKERGFNGNVLIYKNGQMWRKSFGFADVPKKTLLNHNSQFQIASMSKPFTAMAIFKLAMQGKLKLTDTINKYFDCWPYPGMTIDLLLSHQSGIPEYMNLADKYWNDTLGPLKNKDVEELFTKTKCPVYFTPGSRHDYCNSNFILLANIVEKVSGMDFPSFLQKHIFCPLGMDSTFIYKPSDSLFNQSVKGHYGLGNYIEDNFLNGCYGDKNVWSTTADLLRFYKGVMNPEFIPVAWRKKMFETTVERARENSQYARGWRKKVTETDTWIYHTGWWKGFRTNLFFNQTKDECFIVLSNRLKAGFFQNDMIANFFEIGGFNMAYSYFYDSTTFKKKSFESFKKEIKK